MALDEKISGLIGRIYESVDDPERWEGVLLELKDVFEACMILETLADLRHRELSRSTFLGRGGPRFEERIAEYRDGHYKNDPTFQFATRNPRARFCATEDVIPPDDYLEHPFIRWNTPGLGSTHWVVGFTAPVDELTFGLSVHPPAEVGPLSREKKALFKMLFEHMDRAIRLSARPPLFMDGGDCLILLDRNGCIRDLSPAAEELLGAADGLAAWDRQLQASDPNSTLRLNAAILSALTALREGGFGAAVALPRPSGKRDLLLTVTPLLNPASPFEGFRAAALVRITDPEAEVSPSAARRWASMFSFSPAEARLAEALISGDQNLRHAADQLGITYGTARVHLRKLMEKTGTHSQSQLARLLTRIE